MKTVTREIAIVLGGTNPHKELIRNLKNRGYYTILIDYNESPPAIFDADEHIRESTLDKEKVLEIAKKRNACLVISACIDQANVTACYVAEKLNLPRPYSYNTALSVTNKKLMKDIMVSNGIQTSKHFTVGQLGEIDSSVLKFPLIVKPIDGNSSKGVRKAINQKELKTYLKDALNLSRNDTAIIEEFKEGKEIGVDCFIKDKEVIILRTRERHKMIVDKDNPIQQIQSAFWPADLSDDCMTKLNLIFNKIAEIFNLDNTPLLVQAIVENENINIIEFAPRIGGGENYKNIKLYSGFDIIDSAVNSFLGIPVNIDKKIGLNKSNEKEKFCVKSDYFETVFIYAKPCTLGKVIGLEELLKKKAIEYYCIYKETGNVLGKDLSSNNRVGSFIVKSESKSGLGLKIRKVLDKIEVFDINGNPVMKNDIYDY